MRLRQVKNIEDRTSFISLMESMADTKKTHNVLIIAYYFPPMGLSGVQRTQKFVKYLPQFGWKPTVITVTPTGYFAQDYTLLEELKHLEVEIHRVGSLDPTRLFKKKGVVQMPSERVRKTLSFISDIFFIPDNNSRIKNLTSCFPLLLHTRIF
jgi:hypothetical protein